jgi:hypothetical protein
MILPRSPKPLDLKLKPSRCLCAYFVTLHSIAAICLWLALPALLAVAASILLVASAGFFILRDVCFFHARSLERIAFSDNHWRIYQGDVRSSIGPSVQQVSCVDATVLPFALVLRFKFPSGQSRTVPVLADQLSPDAYRKLRQLASFVRMS